MSPPTTSSSSATPPRAEPRCPLAAAQPGDEILTTDHEYGAVNRLLDFVAEGTGARIVRSTVRIPYVSDAAFVDDLFADATCRTRAIVISHITSPSSLIFPVAPVCARARGTRHHHHN